MNSPVTVTKLQKMKTNGEKIVALTAYDHPFAKLVDEAGVHMILVGDSVGMVVQGKSSTLPVTMDEMIYHTKMVSRAVNHAIVVGDMPFMSYQTGKSEAITNAGRFIKEGDAAAIKLEGGAAVSETIRAITGAGIPVLAHIGLLPQSVHQMGGFKVQRDEERLLADAIEVETAGAFAVILEGIPDDISKKVSEKINIPTIGIGAGINCDGQILVLHDVLGLTDRHVPKFVKKYVDLGSAAKDGIRKYVEEVQESKFPAKEHFYG